MIREAILYCIGLCCPIFLLGQGQTTNWYFGEEAGLRFNPDGSVTPLTDGRISTFEGCATISDSFGNLLFYTDGILVYDREHSIMDNGYDLLGNSSSTQSAIIVPNPEDANIYYIFVVDTAITPTDTDVGMHYSIVDLSKNNGKGAVIIKNVKLLDETSEKIAAIIKNCFDRSIWVVTMAPGDEGTRYFDTIYSYEVTAAGVNKKPVKTTFPGLLIEDPRGYLKLSPDGTILASANQTSGLYLFDFDITSGNATGYTRIAIPGNNNDPYGIEFSPNGQYLYVHSTNEVLPPRLDFSSFLLQYDLQAADIQASMVLLDDRPIYRGALQLGENGKIYRTISKNYYEGTANLGVINAPNEKGFASDYQHNAVDLGTKVTNQGLPPFIQSFLAAENLVKNDDGTYTDSKTLCEGNPFTLEADSIPGAMYLWEKDGIPLPAITGFKHTVATAVKADSGDYQVEIIPPNPFECPFLGRSTIEVLPKPLALLGLTECDFDMTNSNDGITEINLLSLSDDLGVNFEFYESIADRDANIPIANPETYQNNQAFTQTIYYRATNELGCSDTGQLDLNILPGNIAPASIGPVYSCDQIMNDDQVISVFELDLIASYYPDVNVTFYNSIEDLANNENALEGQINSSSGIIYAKKDNGSDCLGADIIELIVDPSPVLEMQETYVLCRENEELLVTAPDIFNDYSWFRTIGSETKEISKDPFLRITEAGTYRLEARVLKNISGSETSCWREAKFTVQESETAVIETVNVKDFSANNTLEVFANGEGEYEYSVNGKDYQDSPYFENIEPGIVTVYIKDKNGCGIATREVTVLGYPKFFTPNGDGVNDFWQITGVNDEFEPDALIAIYDRFGSMVAQISPTSSGWSGKSNAFMYPASDYWFKVVLRSGREFTGHFALKR